MYKSLGCLKSRSSYVGNNGRHALLTVIDVLVVAGARVAVQVNFGRDGAVQHPAAQELVGLEGPVSAPLDSETAERQPGRLQPSVGGELELRYQYWC